MSDKQTTQVALKGGIDYNLFGEDVKLTGVSKVVLEPISKTLPLAIGEEVTYRVVAIHRVTVETV